MPEFRHKGCIFVLKKHDTMKALPYLSALAGLVLAVSCGTPAQVAEASEVVLPLPGIEEAETLVTSLAGPSSGLTIPIETSSGPKVFHFYPEDGTDNLTVVSIAPEAGQWVLANRRSYPCFEADGTSFKEFKDGIRVERIGEKDIIVLGALREDGAGKAQRTVMTFDPEEENLQAVSFCGKYISDGRIEGSSYIDAVASALNPELDYARAYLISDASLVELSNADEMTDQAIQWWLKNNPRAQSNAGSISFGAVSPESSLVEAYKKAKKETSANYNAALFNIRGYTVVMVLRKSNGSYVLAWAEPECANKNTDQLLNNVYFRNNSNLILFYYKGKRTFNYQLNLANGRLMK